MRFTISKLAALASLVSLTGLAYADLATDCMNAGGFTEVTLSSPNEVIESVLVSATCPPENAVFDTPSSINVIISPTEADTSAKIYTNSANLVTPSLAGGTLQFLWKTGLSATQASTAGIIVYIPRDQLTSVTASGTGDFVTIEDGFTSLSSINASGVSNIIEAVTSSTTQLVTYTDTGTSNIATIEAIDVSLVIDGVKNIAEVKGAVSNVVLSGINGFVLVEGDVTNVVANGINNRISVNGNNGCAGFPAGAGSGMSDACRISTRTVMVSGTQSCTSNTQNSVCTSMYSSSGSSASRSCQCTGFASPTIGGVKVDGGGSAAARMDRVLVAMVSSVTGLMPFLLF
jgi:hypothetical protein